MAPYRFFAVWNLLSYASLLGALAAVAFLARGLSVFSSPDFGSAAAALLVSFVCDLFDGKFAKSFPRTNDEKRFGEQIDSLVDVVAFGFVPASLVFFLHGNPSPWLVIAAAFYALAVLTRLAYYNVFSTGGTSFVGLPSPMGQYVWAAALLWRPSPLVLGLAYVIVGVLMVSPIKIPRPGLRGLVGLTLAALGLGLYAVLR